MQRYGLPFLLGRLTIGTSFFGHGLVRMPILSTFSGKMVEQFQHSILPQAMILPFSYALPFAELSIGVLLLTGLFTRQALIAGVVVMMMLIFGCTTIQNFEPIGLQLIHAGFCIVLLVFVDAYNVYALDSFMVKKKV